MSYDVLCINHERCREMLEVEAYFRDDSCDFVTGCSSMKGQYRGCKYLTSVTAAKMCSLLSV